MNNLKSILNHLKERFTNPLLFSFACSWLIINWQITVGLIWYDPQQIANEECKSIFEFISWHLSKKGSISVPITIAVAYTFGIPILSNLVNAFQIWTSKWGENWNLQISKGANIPIDKYIALRQDYEKRTELLEEVIAKESEFKNANDSLVTENLEIRNRLNISDKELFEIRNEIRQQNDINILNGRWTNNYADTINLDLIGSEEILIENGKYFILDQNGNKTHAFDIINFYYNVAKNEIFFIKDRFAQKTILNKSKDEIKFNVNILEFTQGEILVGRENATTKIQYIRNREN